MKLCKRFNFGFGATGIIPTGFRDSWAEIYLAFAIANLSERFKRWFLEGAKESKQSAPEHHRDSWWKVMCLTGVDYFSTLGYAPGISFLAAGLLSPLATVFLVLLTLFGALPIYARVAHESPHGQGSIAMLEKHLPGWVGKTFVLCLLGFAATDFIITITLSAADAANHLAQNPLAPVWLQDRLLLTIGLVAMLGAIFLIGFREAIGISVVLVAVYLVLNLIVVGSSFQHILQHPSVVGNWQAGLTAQFHSVWTIVGLSALFFPKLALGMSGFETGVAVMPLVKGYPTDQATEPTGRIHNTRWLLFTAAAIMSVFLLSSAFITTVLIPAGEFRPNGQANGRALAFLAHRYLGSGFGSVYDLSTIAILWFAGASAMAGLLNLVPRYLPRYGMAPDWAKAMRPLTVFFTLVAFAITWLFNADVDAQGGAYATGVLVVMTSAAVAVTLSAWHRDRLQKFYFLAISSVFVYTTVVNTLERPDGIKIASFFIATILVSSLVSRALRATELRVQRITIDDNALRFLTECGQGGIRIVAHRPGSTDYARKEQEAREIHNLKDEQLLFLEVHRGDASEFSEALLELKGYEHERFRILRCESPAIPNALAALMLYIRDRFHTLPHLYLGWTEGNPILYILKYLFLGEGETAPVAREILREAEPDVKRRPRVHVG